MHRATGNLLAMGVVGFTGNLAQVCARVARSDLQHLTTLDREIFRLARAHAALARH